jgi:4'-phosphopantetheinyl transferase
VAAGVGAVRTDAAGACRLTAGGEVGAVWVWAARLDVADPAACRSILGRDELERARALRFEPDRRRFVASHAFARVVLGRYLGVEPGAVSFETGRHGKPAVGCTGEPIEWNMSHSGSVAVVVVARGAEVGVDVEEVRPVPRVDAVARLVCTRTERSALRRVRPPERSKAFLQLWTRKEALAKATGVGLSGLTRTDAGFQLTDLRGIAGYVGAVAARTSAAEGSTASTVGRQP